MISRKLIPLRDEVLNDPKFMGYGWMSDDELVADLNSACITVRKEFFLSDRTLFFLLGPVRATEILDALQACGDSVCARVYAMLTDRESGGVDIALDMSRAMLQQFVADGMITAEEMTALTALSETTETRAQQIGYSDGVTIEWVQRVREAN